VIEAYVDSRGRVEDYRILSDPGASQELLPQVKRMLIFTTFRPAMSMGHPIARSALVFENQRPRIRLPRRPEFLPLRHEAALRKALPASGSPCMAYFRPA